MMGISCPTRILSSECLNPCFGGSWVMIPVTNWTRRYGLIVLILVLVEVGL